MLMRFSYYPILTITGNLDEGMPPAHSAMRLWMKSVISGGLWVAGEDSHSAAVALGSV